LVRIHGPKKWTFIANQLLQRSGNSAEKDGTII
jgi:hypothetical protein